MPLPTPEEAEQLESQHQAQLAAQAGEQGAPNGDLLAPATVFARAGVLPPPQSGAAHDSLWSNIQHAGARILDSVGAGAQDAWGARPLGLDDETSDKLRKAGIFNDYKDGHESFLKDINEAWIRPAAMAADVALRGFGIPALLQGAAAGATQAGEEVEGGPAGQPNPLQKALAFPLKLGGEIGGAAAQGYFGPEFATAGGAHGITREAAANQRATSAALARSIGAVGEDEAGYYDAVPPTPENLAARQSAAAEAGLEAVPPTQPPPVDLHALARRIEPDLFTDYDAMALERETARQDLVRLADERAGSPEAVEARKDLDDLLGAEGQVSEREREGRLQAAMASAPDTLVEKLRAASGRYDAAMFGDSPEMAEARNRLMEADFAMRDMAPDVSDAYRRAQDMAPDLAQEMLRPEEGAEGEKPTPEGGKEEGKPGEVPETALTPAEEAGRRAAPIQGLAESNAAKGLAETADVVGGKEPVQEGEQPKLGAAPSGALKGVKGEGELATRRVSERSEENAVANDLKSAFGDLPLYRRVNMKLQARKAMDFVEKNLDDAKAVAMGTKAAPNGIIPEHVFIALENKALVEGDADLAMELAGSRLSQAGTTMGQRIRSWAERNNASPVKFIQDVQQARESAHPDLENAKANVVDEIRAEVRRAASKPDAWQNFLKGLECGE